MHIHLFALEKCEAAAKEILLKDAGLLRERVQRSGVLCLQG